MVCDVLISWSEYVSDQMECEAGLTVCAGTGTCTDQGVTVGDAFCACDPDYTGADCGTSWSYIRLGAIIKNNHVKRATNVYIALRMTLGAFRLILA